MTPTQNSGRIVAPGEISELQVMPVNSRGLGIGASNTRCAIPS